MQNLRNVKGNTPNSVKTFDIPIGFFFHSLIWIFVTNSESVK